MTFPVLDSVVAHAKHGLTKTSPLLTPLKAVGFWLLCPFEHREWLTEGSWLPAWFRVLGLWGLGSRIWGLGVLGLVLAGAGRVLGTGRASCRQHLQPLGAF